MKRKIILASASPRRREILEQIGLTFEVMPSRKEEVLTKSLPWEMVEELSCQKAEEIVEQLSFDDSEEETVVIGADTLVAYENQMLGKPKTEEEALQMLSMLQGNTHQVYTGVTLYIRYGKTEKEITFHEKTDVILYPISKSQLEEYITTGEPMDKAGAYAIQGRFARYIKEIHGEYNTVVGFPIARIMQELTKLEEEIGIME